MPFLSERAEATHAAMQDPQPGDEFSEMCAFYVYVAHRDGDTLTIVEAHPPCTLPDDGVWSTVTVDEFRERFSYRSGTEGYWVSLYRRGLDWPIKWHEWYRDRAKQETPQ